MQVQLTLQSKNKIIYFLKNELHCLNFLLTNNFYFDIYYIIFYDFCIYIFKNK
jgi:hypothetical protein